MSKKVIALLLTAAMCIPAAAYAEGTDIGTETESQQQEQSETVNDTQSSEAEETVETTVATEAPTAEVTEEPTATAEPEATAQPTQEVPVITSQPISTDVPTDVQPDNNPFRYDWNNRFQNNGGQGENFDKAQQNQQPSVQQPPMQQQGKPQQQSQKQTPFQKIIEKVIVVTPQEARESFTEKTQEKNNSQLSASDYIAQIKALFRSADDDTKLDILKEIGELKKELNDEAIGIFVNGVDIDFSEYDNAEPYIKDDITLVPIRAVADALDADVQWDENLRKITVTKDDRTVVMQIDNPTCTVNGQKMQLEVPPEINNERTMVPIRFISEAFNSDVQWDGDSKTVLINND